MQWVHSLCALVSQHKTGEKWITWATQYLINFTWRTQWFDFLWPPFLLQHRRIAPNHMTWGHTDGGRWRPLVAGLPSLTWWYNWRLGFLDRWSVTSSTCWMGQRSVSGVYLWHWTVSCPAIQSARFFFYLNQWNHRGQKLVERGRTLNQQNISNAYTVYYLYLCFKSGDAKSTPLPP